MVYYNYSQIFFINAKLYKFVIFLFFRYKFLIENVWKNKK